MKFSQLVPLLKLHSYLLWIGIAMVLLYVGLVESMASSSEMFFLRSESITANPLLFPFVIFCGIVFERCAFTKSSKTSSQAEFLFCRAIDRSALFAVKACVYLSIASAPTLTVWACSYLRPTIKVELPYNSVRDREATKHFFLTRFEGAHLEKSGEDHLLDTNFVVLDNGQVSIAAFDWFLIVAELLFIEVIIFALPPLNWAPMMLIVVILAGLAIAIGSPSKVTPSHYEAGLALFVPHTLVFCALLGAATLLIQFYCCRRFVNMEVVS